jgi:WD40 repeat protein
MPSVSSLAGSKPRLAALRDWSLPPRVVRVLGDPRFRLEGPLLALHVGWDGVAATVEEPGILRKWNVASGRQLGRHDLSEMEMVWGFSKDGRRLASAADDWSLWDVGQGKLLYVRPAGSWTTAIAFSTDGLHLATGHDDGRVRLWELHSGRVERVFEHGAPVSALAFGHDGQALAVAGEDRAITLWHVRLGVKQGRLVGHTDRITSLCWDPNGQFLASSGWDTTARLWDSFTCEPIYLLNGQAPQVVVAQFAPQGNLLATADGEHVIWIWDPFCGRVVHRLRGHTGEVTCMAFTTDGKQLLTGGTDGRIVVWDLQTGRNVLRGGEAEPTGIHLSVGPEGRQLASVVGTAMLHVWSEQPDGKTRCDTLSAPNPAVAIAHACDRRLLISGHADGRLLVWDTQSFRPLHTLHEHRTRIAALAVDASGTLLASAGGADGYVYLWSLAEFEAKLLIPKAAGPSTAEAVAFVPGRPLLLVAGVDRLSPSAGVEGDLVLWDLVEPGIIGRTRQGGTALAMHPSGQTVAVALLSESIGLFSLPELTLIQEFVGHQAPATALAYSSDGNTLYSSGADGSVRVWNSASGHLLHSLDLETPVRDLALAPGGRILYTANADTTFYVIDLSGGRPALTGG